MGSMARRFRLLLVGTLAIVAAGLPVPGMGLADAAQLERDVAADAAVVEPAARDVLADFDAPVEHFELALHAEP
jgi:hypothetical protein